MKHGLILIPIVLVAANLCSASDITTLTFNSAGPNSIDGIYTFPYQSQLNGGATVQAMCDDFTNEISNGESWLASANVLSSANAVSDFLYSGDTAFGGATAATTPTTGVQAYDEAGYIFTNMIAGNISATEGNAAVWYLFSPAAAGADFAGDANALGILTQAYNAVSGDTSYDYSNITVYTPSPLSGSDPAYDPSSTQYDGHAYPQEFLIDSPAPEPPPSLLMAAGAILIGLVSLMRRKRDARSAGEQIG